jgi:predicted nucleic acid-binding protein
MYVLDTDVFSLTSPTSGFVAPEAEAWRRWVRRNEHALYFNVATIMEVRFGIEKSLAKSATKKAARLRLWLAAAETVHRGHILPVTIEFAHRAGELLYRGGNGSERRGCDHRGDGYDKSICRAQRRMKFRTRSVSRPNGARIKLAKFQDAALAPCRS